MQLIQSPTPEYRAAMVEFLASRPADFFCTANPNKANLDLDSASRTLRHFHAMIDRKLWGRNWATRRERTSFLAIPEKGPRQGILHFHLMMYVPDSSKMDLFANVAPALFRRASPGGSFKVDSVPSPAHQRVIARYMAKDALIGDLVISDGARLLQ
jgi:hypothetical protein